MEADGHERRVHRALTEPAGGVEELQRVGADREPAVARRLVEREQRLLAGVVDAAVVDGERRGAAIDRSSSTLAPHRHAPAVP